MEKEPDDKLDIFKLIKKDRLNEIKKMKPEIIKKLKYEFGDTPLHYALRNNKFEIAAWLLANNCFNDLFETNKHHQSFLSICYLQDRADVQGGSILQRANAFSEHHVPSMLTERQKEFLETHLSPVIRRMIERIRFNSLQEEMDYIDRCHSAFKLFFPLQEGLRFKILACERFNNIKKAYNLCKETVELEEFQDLEPDEIKRLKDFARMKIAEMKFHRRIEISFYPRLLNINARDRESVRVGLIMYEDLVNNDEPNAKDWLSKIHGLFITGKFSVEVAHERMRWIPDISKAFEELYGDRVMPALKRKSSLSRSGSGFFQDKEKPSLKRKRSSSGLSQELEKKSSSSSSGSRSELFREAKRAKKEDPSKPPKKDEPPKPRQ